MRHYQTPQGKKNKKNLNGLRSVRARSNQGVVQLSRLCEANLEVESDSAAAKPHLPSAATTPIVISSSRTTRVEASAASSPDVGEASLATSTSCALTPTSETHPETTPSSGDDWLVLGGVRLNESHIVHSPLLCYARFVASQIEGRVVGREELVEALLETMRQRSLGVRSRTAYVLDYLHQHPP